MVQPHTLIDRYRIAATTIRIPLDITIGRGKIDLRFIRTKMTCTRPTIYCTYSTILIVRRIQAIAREMCFFCSFSLHEIYAGLHEWSANCRSALLQSFLSVLRHRLACLSICLSVCICLSFCQSVSFRPSCGCL